MDKQRKNDALRRLAQQAKQRLAKGGYEEKKYGSKFKVYEGGIVADYKLVLLSETEDEKFYEKVCTLLKEDKDCINPIGQLVDKESFSKMSAIQKERYIINLAEKYLKMKDRFEKENIAICN